MIRSTAHFTMVELMIVISIILILGVLLMPSLQSALASSYRTTCASNLRQNMIAQLAYSEDHNGLLPHGNGYGWDSCRGINIEVKMAPYLGLNSRYGTDFAIGGIFICPASPVRILWVDHTYQMTPGTKYTRYNHNGDGPSAGYGTSHNSYNGNNKHATGAYPSQRPSYYSAPSRAPWYFCSRGRSPAWPIGGGNNDWNGATPSWHDRYEGGPRPTVFIDGHVKILTMAKYTFYSGYLYGEPHNWNYGAWAGDAKPYETLIEEF